MTDNKKAFQLFKQNSELEVLISAAIVFTAFVINDMAGDWIVKALNINIPQSSWVLFIVAVIALYMSAILPISLISHFILRIYWLSLVGLKSAYPEIRNEEVNPKFDRFVNGSMNIEKHISTIDKICSSIFAFTFLTLFAFLFTFIAVASLLSVIQWVDDPYHIAENIGNIFVLFGLMYLIDFLTLGWFKKIKKKWFTKMYYPIYRFYGWITFAKLYRGIYYSLIQHASKKVMFIITPLYITCALFLLNQGYYVHTLYPENGGYLLDDELIVNVNYQDEFTERMQINSSFIESYIVPSDQNYIKLNLPLTLKFEEKILKECEGVQGFNERGIHWRKWVQTDLNRLKYDSTFNYHKNAELILDCVSEKINIMIDSISLPPSKYFFGNITEPANYGTLITMLDIAELARGNHNLIIKSDLKGGRITIPFWRD